MKNESYLTPAAFGEAEFTEKRSRFIGRVWPVETEAEALEHLKRMREQHWDATHNVYAYVLREGGIMRYSDDGEPQGTSGMPVLNVFRSREIVNVCCVVTRYFGGILLGTGGLVRAYSRSAKLAGVCRWRNIRRSPPSCSKKFSLRYARASSAILEYRCASSPRPVAFAMSAIRRASISQ